MTDHRPLNQSITRRTRVSLYIAVATLAVVASITGLGNGFALDDLALVAGNSRVHSLDQWWRLFTLPYWPPLFGASLYRPMVTLAYALEWAIGNGSPRVFHVASILMYAGVSTLVLALALELVPFAAAAAVAALFAVHPVHVEAVANVVGQSELLAALAMLGASVIYVRARRRDTLGRTPTAAIGLLFAIACLSKEHALLLPALLAALELFVIERPSGAARDRLADRLRATGPLVVTLAAVGVAYVVVRTAAVGELLGEQHLVPVEGARRPWVLLAVVPHWLRLLVWPARLSADYSPQEIAIPAGAGLEIVPGLIILTAAVGAFVALGRGGAASTGDRNVARLGVAWLAVSLLPVSNLLSVMLVAERTLLLPSVGAVMIAGAAVSALLRHAGSEAAGRRARFGLGAALAGLVVLGTARSLSRQPVWRDNQTLFQQTVADAPRSYRAQFFYGQLLFQQGRRAEGERRLLRAIALNPTPSDVSPLNYLATEYRDAGMCPQALPLYERAIAHDAERPDVRYGLAACLLATGRIAEARTLARDGVRRGDLKRLFQELLARADSAVARGG